jgi:penicillin-binding protein 1C
MTKAGARAAAWRAAIDRAVDQPAGGAPRVALAPHAARRLLHAGDGGRCGDTSSTLDAATQRAVGEAVRRQLASLDGRAVRDAAVLVADNASGAVLAYVGSSGTFSAAAQVDGVSARRQAGSTLKPFLYAEAIDRHLLTAAALLDDAPLELAVAGGLFRPRNYDDRFRGAVSVRTALAGSLNIPAVRTLELVGADGFAATLRQLGFSGLDHSGDYYGPSLALGSADVTLWQLVGAYRALANGGRWAPLTLSMEGTAASTAARDISPADATPSTTVFSAAASFITADMLADRASRSVTFGMESPLSTRFWTAVKTGTSTDMRDNWCIGFSRRYTVGVWVGNFSGAPMQDVSGITGAAPIWQEVMEWLHRDQPSPAPPAPAGVRAARIDFAGGIEAARDEWFLDGTEPSPATVARAHTPRLLSPTDGTTVALDPDIPAARQRVTFAAASAAGLRWRLDGRAIAPVDGPLLWPPSAGAHELALVSPDGAVVDTSHFVVRP